MWTPPSASSPVKSVGCLEKQIFVARFAPIADDRQPGAVEVIDQKRAARLQRADHLLERAIAFWQMQEHQARVHQIETTGVEFVEDDVVAHNLDVRREIPPDPPRVDVGHNHMPARPDSPAEPGSDRASSSSEHVQPSPTPIRSRWAIVTGSHEDSRLANRSAVHRLALSSMYVVTVAPFIPTGYAVSATAAASIAGAAVRPTMASASTAPAAANAAETRNAT
jgi:hypothetical protein